MEETLSHDQRRKGGMHYTTVRNIHKVIDPLFLDGLKTELEQIEESRDLMNDRAWCRKLGQYQDKLASLQFLTPRAGPATSSPRRSCACANWRTRPSRTVCTVRDTSTSAARTAS